MIRVTVRDVDELPIGQLSAFTEADFIPRWNGVGTWRMKIPSVVPGAELFGPGCGISVALPEGQTFSGQMTRMLKRKSSDDLGGTLEVAGVEDTAILGFRTVFPVPTQPATSQTAAATYNLSAPAETVARTIARKNIGPEAISGRKITNLAFTPDNALGPTTAISSRFDNLLELTQRILLPTNLGFSIKFEPGGYRYDVKEARDLSMDFKFSEAKGNLNGWEFNRYAPQITQAIVAGQGEGTARNIQIFNDPTSPQTQWGFFIEQFVDRRDTNVMAEMQQAAWEAFEAMNQGFSLTIEPLDTDNIKFGRDYLLGDKITVEVDGIEYIDTITEVKYEYRPETVRITPTIGNAELFRKLDMYRVLQQLAVRMAGLERRF